MPERADTRYSQIPGQQLANFDLAKTVSIGAEEPPIEPQQYVVFEGHNIVDEFKPYLIEKLQEHQQDKCLTIRHRLSSQLIIKHGDRLQQQHDLPGAVELRSLMVHYPMGDQQEREQELPRSTQLTALLDHASDLLSSSAEITEASLLGILIRSQLYEIQRAISIPQFCENIGTATDDDRRELSQLRRRLEVVGCYYAALRSECLELPNEKVANEALAEYYRRMNQHSQAEQHKLAGEYLRREKLLSIHQHVQTQGVEPGALQDLSVLDESQS